MFTTLYINFSVVPGQITLVFVVLSGRNLDSSKLSYMSSLPARMRLIKSKMKGQECSQYFSHYKSMGIFRDAQGQLTLQSLVRSGQISNSSEMIRMSLLSASIKKIPVHSPIWSNFELVQDFMVVLLTCKNEKDPIKNRGARVFTTLYINFSDAQGQITLELVVVSGRNLNSSKLSCMSSLPARMRMID